MKKIGIIGGSGFYSMSQGKTEQIKTPFGLSGKIVELKTDSNIIYFLARHGSNHSLAPHLINYRANIYTLHKLGVTDIIATNAVGSCTEEIKPGYLVLIDQIVDFTSNRDHTFYSDNSLIEKIEDLPEEFSGVKHTDVTNSFDQSLRIVLSELLSKSNVSFSLKGTIGVFNGPRYETAAEIKMCKILGIDVVGMTSAPEVFLANELGIRYAAIAVVTNYAAGLQEAVSHEEVVEMFNQKIEIVKNIVLEAAKKI
jgi:5'-methylthioadenosine phosphorylase